MQPISQPFPYAFLPATCHPYPSLFPSLPPVFHPTRIINLVMLDANWFPRWFPHRLELACRGSSLVVCRISYVVCRRSSLISTCIWVSHLDSVDLRHTSFFIENFHSSAIPHCLPKICQNSFHSQNWDQKHEDKHHFFFCDATTWHAVSMIPMHFVICKYLPLRPNATMVYTVPRIGGEWMKYSSHERWSPRLWI